MSQSDFAFLAIQNELPNESAYTNEADDNCIHMSYQGFVPSQASNEREEYVPVNFVTDDVSALIAAWEASTLNSTTSSDIMDLDVDSIPVTQNRDMLELDA